MWRERGGGGGERERETSRINLSHPRAQTIRPRKLRENVYIIELLLSRAWLSTRPIKITICSMDRFACKLKRGSFVFDCFGTFRDLPLYISVLTRHRFPYIAVGKRSVVRARCIAEKTLLHKRYLRDRMKKSDCIARYKLNMTETSFHDFIRAQYSALKITWLIYGQRVFSINSNLIC